MLEALVDKSHKSQRKDIDGQHVRVIEEFLQSSFMWTYAMDFESMQSYSN